MAPFERDIGGSQHIQTTDAEPHMSTEDLAAFLEGAHFDLGVDALVTSDLGVLPQPWDAPSEHLPQPPLHQSLPAGDALGPWADSLQLPGV